jgi:eukaryotic-like serine/threonine-protein kinase
MIGRLISGRYRLIGPLGEGGMATIWRAVDEQLDREVAVKILRPQFSSDPGFTARFKQEARAAGGLSHPNIVGVYDYGTDGAEGEQYIVMELIDGRDLSTILRERTSLSIDDAVRISIAVASALEVAHRKGIVHRDVKPGNLMVIGGPAGERSAASSAHDPPTGEMTVKLTDFGIARAAEQTRLTQVGSVVGTAAYLAPEQARGEEATPASDVYALGVVIYQFLTGRLPWEGSTLAELATRRENESPLAPDSYNEAIPPTLSTAVLRALEGEVSDRYSTARELSRALRAGITGREPPITASEAPTAALAGASTEATRRMTPEPQTPATVRRPAPPPPPRPRPAPVPAAAPAPEPRPPRARQRSALGRLARALGILLLIAVLAGVIAGAVLLLTDAGQSTDLGVELRDEVDQQIDALRDFIQSNTQ